MYGYPNYNEELKNKLNNKEIILGGCIITDNDPTHYCHGCDKNSTSCRTLYERGLNNSKANNRLHWTFPVKLGCSQYYAQSNQSFSERARSIDSRCPPPSKNSIPKKFPVYLDICCEDYLISFTMSMAILLYFPKLIDNVIRPM